MYPKESYLQKTATIEYLANKYWVNYVYSLPKLYCDNMFKYFIDTFHAATLISTAPVSVLIINSIYQI